jgi:serine-type D-Ala-D-Ala carboxypeptidase/endopeptidase (penicillin-binding protein 4)
LKSLRRIFIWLFMLATTAGGAHAQSSEQTVLGLEFKPLAKYLESIVSDPYLQDARVTIKVVNVESGETLFAHNPDLLVNPASVTKIFTTAAALSLLHPDYRFKTEVYSLNEPENSKIKGPVYLKGYADPYLVNERLFYLASELYAQDIKTIDGSIILDDSFFDNNGQGPGWSQDASSRPYQAPMGALSLNFNAVRIQVYPGEAIGKPARVELFPDSDHLKLVNKITTGLKRTRIYIDTDSIGRRTRVVVRGQVSLHHPGSRHFCRIAFPTWYTGHSFRKAMKQAGIRTRNKVRRGKVPVRAELLYTLRSPALGELVRKVNKRSQNFMAEQLYKTLGAEFISEPGTWHKGQQVINAFLDEEVGIPPGSYILHNGSGLNDVNRITASQVTTLLKYMWGRFDVRPDFLASLAVAGADGTVTGRFAHPTLARTMRLKTGSLENVRALAGYIRTRGNQVYAFAMLISDYSCEGYRISRRIDRLASAISRADKDLMVVEEIEVLPLDNEDQSELISPAGPPEGSEEADIPIGESLTSKGGSN